MTKNNAAEVINRLTQAGISYQDADSLRRISMTLQRWHELECGDSTFGYSFAIERDGDEPDSTPYMVYHANQGDYGFTVYALPEDGSDKDKRRATVRTFSTSDKAQKFADKISALREPEVRKTHTRYESIPDRETGARKRLAKIMARYPGFSAYVQGDPRGAALYILRPGDIKDGDKPDSCYSNGVAVYK